MNSLKKNRKGTNMNNNSGNRETMSNINNHPSGHNSLRRGKNSPQDKNITSAEGIYDNGRLMHAVTSLIGSIVQVVVKGGYTYEGVLKTFSPDFEVVVEMAIEVDSKVINGGQNIGGLLHSLINEHEVHSTMIFKLQDIIMLNVLNVDLDYALKGSGSGKFTDTEISKHDTNSIKERELVPWDGGTSDNDHCTLEDDTHNNSSSQNGWDADAMFKLNEEKYKVSTTYDSSLKDYTTPLEVKDTEEYKQLQAEAEKIATDIERSSSSKNRTMLEDGDEEERFSSVARPMPTNDNFHSNSGRQSNRRKPTNINFNSVGGGRGKSGHSGPLMSSPTSVHQKYQQTQSHHHHHNHHHYYSQPQHTHQYNNYSNKSPSTVSPPTSLPQQKTVTPKEDLPVAKSNISVTNTTSISTNINSNNISSNNNSNNQVFTRTVEQKEYATAVASGPPLQQAPLPQRSQNENRRTGVTKKREEVINELKNFGNDFKLNSEVKDLPLKEQTPKENLPPKQEVKAICTDIPKETPKVSPPPVATVASPGSEKQSPQVETDPITENNDGENVVKKSTLNPNAKEFNPTRSFTPRVSYVSHPVVQTLPHQPAPLTQQAQQPPPQQITIQPHQQQHQARIPNSLVAFPGPFVGPFQIITPNPYMLTQTFNQNNNTRPNFRSKGPQQYHNQNRHDYSQSSVNVVTATGHPVLTGHPNQITFNHTNQVGAGAPQAYHNVYTRMVSPGVQCVPFDPSLQHYYGVPSMLIPQNALNNGTQVSAPSTPQSGQPSTPIHTGPPHTPPVHHTGGSSQPQQQLTQTIMYTVPTTVPTQHGGQTQMTSQTSNCNYIGQLPPLLHIGPVHQNMSHSSSATQHGSTQAPLISAVPGTIPVIPTSATVVASQGAMQTHYGPNPQNRI